MDCRSLVRCKLSDPDCRPIIEGDPEISDVARLLFEAPFAVLAHDVGEEPNFNYANKVTH